MKSTPIFRNIDKCMSMLALSSPSDLSKQMGGNGEDSKGVAETALSIAKNHKVLDVNQKLYSYLIDVYTNTASQDTKIRFANLLKRLTLEQLEKRGMKKKRANQIAKVALHCLLVENVCDAERARMIEVKQDNYIHSYKSCTDYLINEFYTCLFIADDVIESHLLNSSC